MNNQLENEQKICADTSKKDIQMVNKHMKVCSTLLAVREMKTKTTDITICLSAIKIRNSDNAKCWWECRESRLLTHCWWE